MGKLIDIVCPPRMGSGFRWMLGSSWISNIGDGIAVAAGPLLVASQTNDPLLVALAGLLGRLPWLLFGLHAGVIADRHDRRLIVVAVNLVRAAVLALLAISIATGVVSVAVVLVSVFVLGTAETFADITTSTLLPMMLEPGDLGVANARLGFGQITLNQLVGPPVGAFMFAAGMVLPWVAQVITAALGAVLIARIVVAPPERSAERSRARTEIAEGVRWLWHHPTIRTLTLTVVFFNITFGAALSIEVLYAIEHLDSGEFGFGLLMTASAVGGVIGTTLYGWLERTMGLANIMRAGLIIETLTHLTLANTHTLGVAMAILAVFGVHEAAWGTTVVTVRQRAVPKELQGRIGGVYMMALQGGLVVGAAIGGVVAKVWGVTGPYWFAFAGSALILVVIWPRLSQIARTD
jgi:MFS family permease